MKARKLFVTLELITDEHLKDLKSSDWWQKVLDDSTANLNTEVVQVQINVSKAKN